MNAVLIALLAVLALSGLRYGADTRDGRDWRRGPQPRTSGYRRQHSLPADLRRLARSIRDSYRAQNDLWERYFRAQRPWESRTLRWTRDHRGWRLEGDTMPRRPRTPSAPR